MRRIRRLVVACLLISVLKPVVGQPFDIDAVREVRGTVVEAASGRPVAGANISLHWEFHWIVVSMRPTLDRGVTDGSGAFMLRTPMLADQPFRIHVEGKGIVEFMSPRFERLGAEPLQIEAPSEGGWIAGNVVSPDGNPVTVGRVEVRLAEDEKLPLQLQYLTPDENGFFTMGPVANAEYRLRHSLPGSKSEFVNTRPVTAERVVESPITVTALLPGILRVKVLTSEGTPVARGRVTMKANTTTGIEPGSYELDERDGKDNGWNFRSKQAGEALFTQRGPGRYVFSASTSEGTGSVEHLVEEGATGDQTVVLKLDSASASLRGTVRMGGETTSPPLSVVLERQEASLEGRQTMFFHLKTECNSAGLYSFEHVVPATYSLTVRQADGRSVAMERIELADGEKRLLDFEIPAQKLVTIKGVVHDPQGRPIADCNLTLRGHGPVVSRSVHTTSIISGSSRSNPQGEFEFSVAMTESGAPTAPWELVIEHAEFCAAMRIVDPSGDSGDRLDIALLPKFPLRVEFLAAEGTAQTSATGRLEFAFGAGSQYQPHPRRSIELGDPDKSAIERLLVERAVPINFNLRDKNIRMEGEPIWIRDGEEFARGSYRIDENETGSLTVRIRLAVGPETRRYLHLRALDYGTGKPLEGIQVEAGNSTGYTLPDGTCEIEIRGGAKQIAFDKFSLFETDKGELIRNKSSLYGNAVRLSDDLATAAEDPMTIRGVLHASGRRVQLTVEDGLGNEVTERIAAIDGRLTWTMTQPTPSHDLRSIHIPHTGDNEHTVYLTMGGGNPLQLEIVDGASGAIQLAGNSALKFDFDAFGPRSYFNVRLRIKDQLLIPGIDY